MLTPLHIQTAFIEHPLGVSPEQTPRAFTEERGYGPGHGAWRGGLGTLCLHLPPAEPGLRAELNTRLEHARAFASTGAEPQ